MSLHGTSRNHLHIFSSHHRPNSQLSKLFNMFCPRKHLKNVNIYVFFFYSDQFILDKDDYGRIVGRIKDIIIRGGENIYPKEVEDILDTHPDVIESQVSLYCRYFCVIVCPFTPVSFIFLALLVASHNFKYSAFFSLKKVCSILSNKVNRFWKKLDFYVTRSWNIHSGP